ncbi:hypothetical protein ACFS2C_03980 [Prauserella oleivorans]|uniref:Uncharacterized protein n=1 Tax=Prauserella oleivorans TaxID=1478153 RepID=A0ABW5W5Z1_9PSEU
MAVRLGVAPMGAENADRDAPENPPVPQRRTRRLVVGLVRLWPRQLAVIDERQLAQRYLCRV